MQVEFGSAFIPEAKPGLDPDFEPQLPFRQFHGQYLFDRPFIEFEEPDLPEEYHQQVVLLGIDGFRFSNHFHPYATELVRRLTRPDAPSVAGVPSLQASDTRYKLVGTQRWKVLPDSTSVTLPATTQIKLPDGAEVDQDDTVTELYSFTSATVAFTCRAFVPDATVVQVNGSNVTIPGSIVPSTRAMWIESLASTIELGDTINLGATKIVTLPSGAVLAVGGNQVILRKPARALLVAAVNAPFAGARPEPELFGGPFFKQVGPTYIPGEKASRPFPLAELDFAPSGAYSVYNWELFYHAPLAVAMHLSKNQRFLEAQRWFHFVFDPTDSGLGPTPERFWKVLPFQTTDVRKIEEILLNLSTGDNPGLQSETIRAIQEWQAKPFRPHVIARWRQTPYMLKTVMAYLDNLIAWGDSLFRQDTRETINEATQIYILAANLLGPRPQAVPRKGSVGPRTYEQLKAAEGGLDEFSNALVELETDIPFDIAPSPDISLSDGTVPSGLGHVAPYFCVPRNDKLLSYWDTVADRLFKIHNSLNIKGVFRQLALFEPPIDPALLAKGVAAGLDIGAIVGGMNQPLPLVRFTVLAQKATEICQEVKSLGAGLLSAIEKEDNEALAVLRARHESVILGLTEMVRYSQYQEAVKAREGVQQTLANATERFVHYERLLGASSSDIRSAIPQLADLDAAQLQKLKLNANEPGIGLRDIGIEVSGNAGGVSDGEVKTLSTREVDELNKLKWSQRFQDTASGLDATAAVLRLIPDFGIEALPWGVGGEAQLGGNAFAEALRTLGTVARGAGGRYSYWANKSAKIGSYQRREQDWAFQSNTAAGDMSQSYKQLRAAQIREAIAKREWENHKKQMQHAKEIEDFLTNERNGKTSNQALYTWMKREVKGLYNDCFQFAFDVCKKTERAMQHELGVDTTFIQFGYLAGKQGLLAGDKLFFDLKQMELAYHDLNEREYELTKPVSVLQLDPMALVRLRRTGRCDISLPEELFDLDCPGHYFRRLKSVAVSIPSVVGPFTNVNCTLTLLGHDLRLNTLPDPDEGGYARTGTEDSRFRSTSAGVQAVVTSSAQNDSGLFETNLRDERYLPFEGAGAISRWRLELPAEFRQFDYDNISDVILHLRYTAREGGEPLRKASLDNVRAKISDSQITGATRLFSIRQEFGTEWARFRDAWSRLRAGTASGPPWPALTFSLSERHYPYWCQPHLGSVRRAVLIASSSRNNLLVLGNESAADAVVAGATDSFITNPSLPGLRVAVLENNPPASPVIDDLTFHFNSDEFEDLWLVVSWGPAD